MPYTVTATEATVTEVPRPSVVVKALIAAATVVLISVNHFGLFLFICNKKRRKSLSVRIPHSTEETQDEGRSSDTSTSNLILPKPFQEPMSVSASESDLDTNTLSHPLPETICSSQPKVYTYARLFTVCVCTHVYMSNVL